MKYTILTLGCKVNSYESAYFKEHLDERGYTETTLEDSPEIIIINTCSVTNQSDAKSRHVIRNARRKSPDAVIVACGCSVQNHQTKLRDLGADILVGTFGKAKIVDMIEEYIKSKNTITENFTKDDKDFENMFVKNENDKTRAFVKIQDGCNNYCTYCIIPYLRGNIRSKDIEDATKEIKSLVDSGHKEIVLTGIHTGSYGRDKDYDLVDLIRRISKFDNLKRIRISSIEATELDDKFLEELKNNPKICNHLHIPLQSGSDTVLKYMNRIRKIRPGISITTDLILGFPHEDDKCFKETYEFLKKCEFTKIHTFPFSLRNGTAAEHMKDYFVNDKDKKERVRKVLDLSLKLENIYYKKFIGKTMPIIVETTKDGITRGHTDNYILVEVPEKLEDGSMVDVEITQVDNQIVKGTTKISTNK